jgi:hypothetical protein
MSMAFRKPGPRLPIAAQVRQGRAVKTAQAALVTVEAVCDFLNNHHEGLGGRPLDIALRSDADLAAVEAAISEVAWMRAAAS